MHYGILDWTDYARGVAPEGAADRMNGHLAQGCAECADLAGFARKLSGVCQAMAVEAAPERAVRLARAVFPVRRRAPRAWMDLIFDSFLAPSPAGLRASWQIGWQALYRAGDCSLDVRIEPDLHSSRAALIGQVSNHAAPDALMGNIPVCLKSGRHVVAETRSNRFGEFQIEYDQEKKLQLHIYLEGGARCIVAPLRKIAGQYPGAGDGASGVQN